jgi:hypothetical protein
VHGMRERAGLMLRRSIAAEVAAHAYGTALHSAAAELCVCAQPSAGTREGGHPGGKICRLGNLA